MNRQAAKPWMIASSHWPEVHLATSRPHAILRIDRSISELTLALPSSQLYSLAWLNTNREMASSAAFARAPSSTSSTIGLDFRLRFKNHRVIGDQPSTAAKAKWNVSWK